MKTHISPSKATGLLACALLTLPRLASAQEAAPPDRMIQSPRIVHSHTVRKADGGLMTFQRIEPPVNPVAPVKKAAAEVKAQAREQRPIRTLMFTARVYEGSLTEVSWTHDGKVCRAWSSVDFRLLQNVQAFELRGVRWSFFTLTSSQHRDVRNPAKRGPSAHKWPEFSVEMRASVPAGMRAWYSLVEFAGSTEEEAAACAGMDALHEYVEEHWTELELERTVREAKAAADAAWQAAHPPPPPSKDAIIQFWPVKSAVHLPKGANSKDKGGRP